MRYLTGHGDKFGSLVDPWTRAQRMTVTVDGNRLYDWPVSTGGGGNETPSGAFKPPMPYSIFFTQSGDAIHGTYEQRSLGRASRTAA